MKEYIYIYRSKTYMSCETSSTKCKTTLLYDNCSIKFYKCYFYLFIILYSDRYIEGRPSLYNDLF